MSKALRWALLVSTLVVIGAALVIAFMLSMTSERDLFERNFVWLFWVNLFVAAALLLVIAIAATRLVVRLRSGKFGSRLLLKLAGIFAFVGVVPGVLIYTVSVQFVSRSIETWFDAQVASALDAGLTLGRGTLDALGADLVSKTRLAAERLADSRTNGPLTLERLREQLEAREVMLVGASGQVLAAASAQPGPIMLQRPPAAMLRQARVAGAVSQFEGLDDEPKPGEARAPVRVRALALLPSSEISLTTREDRFLYVTQLVPPQLVANALAVQNAYREYQRRAIAQDGLRRMYIGTLTLALVLAVFGAVLVAAILGNQIARPLLVLAEGVREVAEGDLKAKPVFASRDELGGLTRAFARMTEQLADAREQVGRGVAQLESARTRLQTILDSLSAGVIVFDRQRRIDTVNPGATRILRQPLSACLGKPLEDLPSLAEFAHKVWQRFELHAASPEAGERDHWQDAFELRVDEQTTLNLLVRGAVLPNEARLMVFDDITEVVSAQRSIAWAEVARRLAHEIKNPLMPIQLSAERMQHRLEPVLAGNDRALLERSVGTIVAQVQAMKQLVDEFRDYARLPAAQLAPLELNTVVLEVLALYGQAQEQGRVVAQLGADLPPIMGDASQLRQVIHNLLQNALDAVAERPDARVTVRTEFAHGHDDDARAVRLSVSDNGPGFADKVLRRAFEPYVTTKPKGTGLGLAVVRKIADEHGARVRLGNLRRDPEAGGGVAGAQVSLSFSRLSPISLTAAGAQAPQDAGGAATQVH
ncbi:MAG: HAMP domain-containing protein [Ideonella sp.]|nr:MAG: HAMP domain-containing protein [Burkholderiaceae bacterium]MBE7425787.1 HAMP domain-containing protein [Ideonella sp.]